MLTPYQASGSGAQRQPLPCFHASTNGTASRSNHEPTESDYRIWQMNGNVLNWGGIQVQQGTQNYELMENIDRTNSDAICTIISKSKWNCTEVTL
jgi:hypothetical protein